MWGMPAAAIDLGATEASLPLTEIPAKLVAVARARTSRRAAGSTVKPVSRKP